MVRMAMKDSIVHYVDSHETKVNRDDTTLLLRLLITPQLQTAARKNREYASRTKIAIHITLMVKYF
jgi:hypothetical protein